MRCARLLAAFSGSYQIAVILAGVACLAFGKVEVERTKDRHLLYRLEREAFLSAKAKKELTSGVSTKVIVMARLIEMPTRIASEQVISLDSRYDLWEEKFFVNYSNGVKQVIKNQPELEALIEGPGPFEIAASSGLVGSSSYRLEIVETVNPLNTERFEAVQKWVTRQKLSLRGASSSNDPGNASSTPETSFSALFYTLWRRASSGEILTGELRRELRSEIFRPDTLKISTKIGAKP